MTEYVVVRRRGSFGPFTVPPGMPHGPYAVPGKGRVRGAGMGDWGAAITTLLAEDELNDLMKGVRKLNDNVVSAIESRNSTLKGYQEALKLSKKARAKYGPPMLGVIPNFRSLPAFAALGTARKGVRVFARQIQLMLAMDRVFTSISVELTKAGLSREANAIDMTLGIMRRFIRETDDMFRLVSDYGDTKRKILSLAEDTIMPKMGITRFDYANPKWMVAYSKAAEEVVPLPNDRGVPGELRAAGMGNPLPTLVVALIWIIAVIAAAIVAASSISKMIDSLNSKAVTAEKLILSCQERKKEVELAMRRQGASGKEIVERLKQIDASCKRDVEAIPDPVSPFSGLLAPIGILVGVAVGGKVAGVF